MHRVLNQRTARHLPFEALLDLAASVDCMGVGPRNDLVRPIFDGLSPATAAEKARQRELRQLAVGEVYSFNG